MSKFKIGERVRDKDGAQEEATVIGVRGDHIEVQWATTSATGEWPADGFDRCFPSPVRTVTRQEIVGGDFGRIRVLPLDYVDSKKVGVRIKADRGDSASLAALDATELRAAAAIFITLADALDA